MSASTVSVYVRIKPEELDLPNLIIKNDTTLEMNAGNNNRSDYTFNRIFDRSTTQEMMFKTCAIPVIDQVLEGINGTVIAYGQTGAGKTYTMSGPSTSASNRNTEQGLTMRTVNYLFDKARKLKLNKSTSASSSSSVLSIKLSVIEIYNEQITDLLREPSTQPSPSMIFTSTASYGATSNNSSNTAPHPKLHIVETASGIQIPDLFMRPILTEEDANVMLIEAFNSRVVKEHQLNKQSNRSHVVYTLHITRTTSVKSDNHNNLVHDIVESKLNLVDLAGSERSEKTGTMGQMQRESSYINKSLSYLEQVVVALTQSNRDHIPYRQSKLTYLLKDSLGGNCNTLLIACIWPHQQHLWECISTLRFAQRMKCIMNKPIRTSLVSKDSHASASIIQQLDALKSELAMRDMIHHHNNRSTTSTNGLWSSKLSKAQRLDTYNMTKDFVQSPQLQTSDIQALSTEIDATTLSSNSIKIQSVAQAKYITDLLKLVVWEACDQDQQKVMELMNRTLDKITGHVSVYHESYNNSNYQPHSNSDGNSGGDHADDNDDVAAAAVYDDNGAQQTIKSSKINVPDDVKDSFNAYCRTTEGTPFYNNYNDSKVALKAMKGRYQSITSLLTDQSNAIEQLNLSMSLAATAEVQASLIDAVNAAKSEYKNIHSELQLCKEQIAEMQQIKKTALAILLEEFNVYTQYNMSNKSA